jgi:hypothetical protein
MDKFKKRLAAAVGDAKAAVDMEELPPDHEKDKQVLCDSLAHAIKMVSREEST